MRPGVGASTKATEAGTNLTTTKAGSRIEIDDSMIADLCMLEFPGPLHARVPDEIDGERYKSTGRRWTRLERALVRLGGSPSDRDGTYAFPADARVRVDLAIATRSTSPKAHADAVHVQSSDRFARLLVGAASVEHGMRTLEPSAGRGSIVLALQDAGAVVTAVERSTMRREHLLLRVLKSRDRLTDAVDFATYRPSARFDRVVMFPPPARCGAGDHVDHVQRAYGLLRPRGVLVAVLPGTLPIRRDERSVDFLAWCRERGEILPTLEASVGGLSVLAMRLEVPAQGRACGAASRGRS